MLCKHNLLSRNPVLPADVFSGDFAKRLIRGIGAWPESAGSGLWTDLWRREEEMLADQVFKFVYHDVPDSGLHDFIVFCGSDPNDAFFQLSVDSCKQISTGLIHFSFTPVPSANCRNLATASATSLMMSSAFRIPFSLASSRASSIVMPFSTVFYNPLSIAFSSLMF